MYSIRDRLLWTFCICLILAGVAATYMTFISAKAEVNRFLDIELRQVALSVSATGDITNFLPQSRSETENPMVIQIHREQGQINQLSSGLTEAIPVPQNSGFANILHEGQPWRAYVYHVNDDLSVITAQPTRVRIELAFTSALHILQPLILLLPFLVIAIWLLVTQGLASLNRTAKIVATRSSTSLEPIPTQGLPIEVLKLVEALNDLLARLNESLEAQKRFASDAAHELRTPLTALKLQVQLAERAKTPQSQEKAFSRLHAGIDRATGLVQQLLTIARLDPDAHTKPFVEVNVEQILKSVSEELTVLAQQKHIRIDVDAQPAMIMGMEDVLKLLLINLCDNAIRYTQPEGRILLSTKIKDHRLLILVSDNGPGIAAEERERIFDRFYRALGTKTQGNGLGLAIVKRAVQLHHGTIRVTDGLDNQGTTMEISLPLYQK